MNDKDENEKSLHVNFELIVLHQEKWLWWSVTQRLYIWSRLSMNIPLFPCRFYLILGTCFVKTEAAVLFNRLRLVWSQLTRRLTSLVNIVIVSQRLKVLLTASYLEMRSEGTLTKYAFYFPWIHILHNKIRNWLYLEALELLTEQLADRTCVICLCQTAEVSIRK